MQLPSEERAEAYTRRHDSPEDAARDERISAAHRAGLDGQDRAHEERAAQERDQLATERHARIREARARLDAAAGTPRTPAPDDREQDRQARDDDRTWTSHSTGRCNGFREYICRRPIAECLAWPGIELARDPIQLSLCVAGEVINNLFEVAA